MQTFMPHPIFEISVRYLDNKRLGKQRVEAFQILKCLESPNRWRNHPAVLMWKGYEKALTHYMNCCIKEWVWRGFNNTMQIMDCHDDYWISMPAWIGDEKFHSSHRSNLIRKNPIWYGKYHWKESPDLPYFWPTKNGY